MSALRSEREIENEPRRYERVYRMLRHDGYWIELFGGLRACRAEHRHERFTTQKCALLLAYLARFSERPASRTLLATMLWPDKDEPSGRNNLSTAISFLRRQLDPHREGLFVADRNTIRLHPDAFQTDVAAFLAEIDAARTATELSDRLDRLHSAVRLYKGPFLPQYHLDWVLDEQVRLAQSLRRASNELVELLLRLGDAQAAHAVALRTLNFDPLDEHAVNDLLRACLASGRIVEGWSHYNRYYERLYERLGVQPGPNTEAIAQRLRSALPTVAAVGSPAPEHTASSNAQPQAPPEDNVAEAHPTARQHGSTHAVGSILALGVCNVAPRRKRRSIDELRQTLRESGGQRAFPTPTGAIALFDTPSAALATALLCIDRGKRRRTPVKAALVSAEFPVDANVAECPETELAETMLSLARPFQVLCEHATALLIEPNHPEWTIANVGCYDIGSDFPRRRLFALGYPGHDPSALMPPRALPSGLDALPLPLGRDAAARLRWRELADAVRGRATQLITFVADRDHPDRCTALAVLVRELADGYGSVYYAPPESVRTTRSFEERLLAAMANGRFSSERARQSLLALLGGHSILLVIDGVNPLDAEHAELLRFLLERRPELTCIVVAERPLGLPEEFVLPRRLLRRPTLPLFR